MGNSPPKPTLDEQLREHRRQIDRAIRELDRERMKLESEEKKIKQDMKNAAAKDEISSARILAKDLVRTRRHIQKFHELRSQLQAVRLRLQTVKSTQAMGDSMKNVSSAMVKMNKNMDVPGLQKILQDFAAESDRMELTETMLTDCVEDSTTLEDDEIEEAEIVNRVFEEVGIDIGVALAGAPRPEVGTPLASSATQAERVLEDRLQNLRR